MSSKRAKKRPGRARRPKPLETILISLCWMPLTDVEDFQYVDFASRGMQGFRNNITQVEELPSLWPGNASMAPSFGAKYTNTGNIRVYGVGNPINYQIMAENRFIKHRYFASTSGWHNTFKEINPQKTDAVF